MKRCDYCGRENDAGAVHCSECGTTEFVEPNLPNERRQIGFLISKRTKVLFACGAVAVAGLLFVAPRFSPPARLSPVPQAIFFHIPTAIGTTGFSFDISNQADRALVYIMAPVQILSNGDWVDVVALPSVPRRMIGLAQGRTATLNTLFPTNHGTYRIPLLWGYQPRFGFGHWVWTWVKKRFTGRNDGYRLETYTNFSGGISVP